MIENVIKALTELQREASEEKFVQVFGPDGRDLYQTWFYRTPNLLFFIKNSVEGEAKKRLISWIEDYE